MIAPQPVGADDLRPDEVLLQAAFLSGENAACAYHRWKTLVNIDDVDDETYRLLPKLHRNLAALALADELTPRLKGIYRKTWYENQFRRQELGDALETLAQAGVEVLILPGSLLVVDAYQDLGVCPLDDCQVLVHPQDAERAGRLLSEAGWVALGPGIDQAGLPVQHAACFAGRTVGALCMHWRILHHTSSESVAAAQDEIWARAKPASGAIAGAYALSAPDGLLFVLDYGFGGDPPARWVFDALATLHGFSEDDWDLLATLAGGRAVAGSLASMLTYLRQRFQVGIPAHVLARVLAAAEHARLFSPALASPPFDKLRTPLSGWAYLRQARSKLWQSYVSTAHQGGTTATLPGFLAYLRQHWGLASTWQVPAATARRLMRLTGRGERPPRR